MMVREQTSEPDQNMRIVLSALVLSYFAAMGTTSAAQPSTYESIQIEVGLEKFVLTPTPALIAHGIRGASSGGNQPNQTPGETFSFGERDPSTHKPMLPKEANTAWRTISGEGVANAVAFTYFLNCSTNPQLPPKLAPLCQVPLLERGLLLNIKANVLFLYMANYATFEPTFRIRIRK